MYIFFLQSYVLKGGSKESPFSVRCFVLWSFPHEMSFEGAFFVTEAYKKAKKAFLYAFFEAKRGSCCKTVL